MLDAALEFAGQSKSTGCIVLHNGRLVAERYWADGGMDTRRDIASAQKSITSALVGVALHRGLVRSFSRYEADRSVFNALR